MKTASKLTPGPWTVRQGGEHGRDPQAFDVVRVNPETGYPHPIARGFWGGEADMTLAATSPELLVACEVAAKMIDDHFTRKIRDAIPEWYEVVTLLHTVTAKARGRTERFVEDNPQMNGHVRMQSPSKLESAGPCGICHAKAGEHCRTASGQDLGLETHTYGGRFS